MRIISRAKFLDEMRNIVSIRISDTQSAWLNVEAAKAGMSRSMFLRQLLPSEPEVDCHPATTTKELKSETVHVWVTAKEKQRLHKRLAGMETPSSVSAFMRAALRQELDMARLLTEDEVSALSDAVYQLRAIGRNLNQITRAVHVWADEGGDCEALDRLTTNYMVNIMKRIDAVAHKTAAFIAKSLRGNVDA